MKSRGACRKSWMGAAAALLIAGGAPAMAAAADDSALKFNRDVRPILSDKCFLCHGPDKNMRKADLRLDQRENAVDAHPGVISPGNPDTSKLVQRILSSDPDEQMPPPDSGRVLTEKDKATLAEWIRQGAEYQPHWAYIVPVRPDLPAVRQSDWPKNPVDAFVLQRLERDNIAPSLEADRATLLRRLSFDLLGLPPSPEETQTFLTDTSPDAYERLVERLLASPHFGERMAARWLDLVRYADTNGYHGDEHRSVWPYRDYVINAFNSGMSFDQFTREQVGGDLMPNATREQKVAATYNRLNQLTAEGGAQAKEYLAKYAADRVRTVSAAWLATTMGCAECHDHKFDPFTMRDFYSLESFFSDIEERGVYGAGERWDPLLMLPTEAQQQELEQLAAQAAALDAQLNTPTEALAAAQLEWEAAVLAELAGQQSNWSPAVPAQVKTEHGTTLTVLDDASVLASGENPDKEVYEVALPAAAGATGLRLEALQHAALGDGLSRGNGNFVLTKVTVAADGNPVELSSAMADFAQDKFPAAAAIDDKPESGWAVEGHDKRGVSHQAVFTFAAPLSAAAGGTIQVRLHFESGFAQHSIGCFRLSLTTAAHPELPADKRLPEEIQAALHAAPDARTDEQKNALAGYYRGIAPALDETRRQLADVRQRKDALDKEIPFTLATVAVPAREIRVLPRGNWMDDSGEIRPAATPQFMPALAVEGRPLNRLDLADWLVSEQNPLTARVFMNRLWAQLFGIGICKTSEDIGSQGEWPTHPELLDWLAVEFRESGWDIKHMVRTIVNSATYRQSSATRPELQERDPFNRLLARQSRFRLDAEIVRDNALAVSGLLSAKIGGRSVFPYQPEGYWDSCNTFTGPLIYNTDQGEDQYRRGLYTYWKRTFLHPSMQAFDAPTREECTAERVSSNTPLQALVLLNDPTYVEAARVLAERVWRQGGQEVTDRIHWAFRQILSREPADNEVIVVANLYAKHRAEYLAHPESAAGLLSIGMSPAPKDIDPGELAAWTSVARVLLNLHETITRT